VALWLRPSAASVEITLLVFEALCATVAQAAISDMAADAYFGRPVALSRTLGRLRSRFAAVLGASILLNVFVMVGCLMFVVPGLLLMGRYFAAPAIALLEDTDASTALRRSGVLAAGSLGRIITLYVLMTLACLVFFFVGLMAIGVVMMLSDSAPAGTAATLGLAILVMVIQPVMGCLTTLVYHDLRIRREGLDMELMTHALDGSPIQPPSPA